MLDIFFGVRGLILSLILSLGSSRLADYLVCDTAVVTRREASAESQVKPNQRRARCRDQHNRKESLLTKASLEHSRQRACPGAPPGLWWAIIRIGREFSVCQSVRSNFYY